MKVAYIVDKIPESCDECPFKTEILAESDKINSLDLVEACAITNLVDSPCYLNENSEYIIFAMSNDKIFLVDYVDEEDEE